MLKRVTIEESFRDEYHIIQEVKVSDAYKNVCAIRTLDAASVSAFYTINNQLTTIVLCQLFYLRILSEVGIIYINKKKICRSYEIWRRL